MHKINYATYNWLAYRSCNDSLRRHLFQLTGRVVDLGCGTAPFKSDILALADEYIGVDWPNSLHDAAQVDVRCDLCTTLPFPDAFADTVISTEVLEHIPTPSALLSEAARILKPGGLLFLTVPFQWHVHEAPYDYYRYTRFGLFYLLKEAGFEHIEITEDSGFWQTWLLKFNYHTARYARGVLKLFWIPIWWIDQTVAPVLDRLRATPQETMGYAVLARKP